MSTPSHSGDLEITQMRAVLLFCLARKPGLKELNWIHSWDKGVDMMLREVAPVSFVKILKKRTGGGRTRAIDRSD